MSGNKKEDIKYTLSDALDLAQLRLELLNLAKLYVKYSYKFFKLLLLKVYVSVSLIFEKKFKSSSLLGIWVANKCPSKAQFADAILLLFCKPDDAEVAAGDLFEQLEKVQSRHGNCYSNFWFFWELSLLIIVKGRKRLTKSVLGPLADLLKRKSG